MCSQSGWAACGFRPGAADVADGAQLLQLLRLGRHRGDGRLAEIEVDPLRVCAHVAVVRLLIVELLNQVVPGVPFPDDLAGCLACRLNFEKGGRSAGICPADRLRPATGGDRVLGGLLSPRR